MARRGDNLGAAKIIVAALLAFVAGFVDAVGWLGLNHVFAANMSGNAVLLAVHLVTGKDANAALQGMMIGMFFIGLVLSGGLIEIGLRLRQRRILAAALLIEFALLVAFTIAGSQWTNAAGGGGNGQPALPIYLLGAVMALAMGAQNTILRMAGILTVYTTHVTGTLTNLSEEIITCAFAVFADARRVRRRSFARTRLSARSRAGFRKLIRPAALLSGFFLGALVGSSLLGRWGLGRAMILPLLLLLGIGVFDWLVPLTRFPSAAGKK